MLITKNSAVSMHYTVSSVDGVEIDSSRDGQPLSFIQGSQFLIPGLEDALEGKAVGDQFEVTVNADQGYGPRHDTLVQAVPREMFNDMEVEVGMTFRATADEGEQSVTVIDVNDEEVTVDGNHPLAGVDLHFAVEIMSVREATAEEVLHGHVHGEGGCGHSH